MGELKIRDQDYLDFLKEVKSTVIKSRIQIIRSANRKLIQFYWWLGEQIVLRQEHHGWGKSVVEFLASDMREAFPNTQGFSARNLWQMQQFYREYREDPILQQLAAELPWTHNMLILNKIKDDEVRAFYLKATADMGWSRNVLTAQIASQLYERQTMQKQHNFNKALPEHLAGQANEAMKGIYMLDMLGLKQPVLEAELEAKMVDQIKNVMLELGYGFSFIGNQYAIRANNKEYFIDLLFYNRRIQALVAVELKAGGFKPEYSGKMNFYLNLLNDFVREPHENPSIGIILCSDHDTFEVEYALKGLERPVGIANHQLTQQLPAEFADKLPEPRLLQTELQKCLAKD